MNEKPFKSRVLLTGVGFVQPLVRAFSILLQYILNQAGKEICSKVQEHVRHTYETRI